MARLTPTQQAVVDVGARLPIPTTSAIARALGRSRPAIDHHMKKRSVADALVLARERQLDRAQGLVGRVLRQLERATHAIERLSDSQLGEDPMVAVGSAKALAELAERVHGLMGAGVIKRDGDEERYRLHAQRLVQRAWRWGLDGRAPLGLQVDTPHHDAPVANDPSSAPEL